MLKIRTVSFISFTHFVTIYQPARHCQEDIQTVKVFSSLLLLLIQDLILYLQTNRDDPTAQKTKLCLLNRN